MDGVDDVGWMFPFAALPFAFDLPYELPLNRAASRGDLEAVEELLGQGADVNAANTIGDRPLFVAAYWGRLGIAELLLRRGAEVDAAVGRLPLCGLLLAHIWPA